jgi:hypothetical protein
MPAASWAIDIGSVIYEALIVTKQMSRAITASAACLRVEQMSPAITAAPSARKDNACEICIPMSNGISTTTGAHLLDWG